MEMREGNVKDGNKLNEVNAKLRRAGGGIDPLLPEPRPHGCAVCSA